jgi:hypothetical protein
MLSFTSKLDVSIVKFQLHENFLFYLVTLILKFLCLFYLFKIMSHFLLMLSGFYAHI